MLVLRAMIEGGAFPGRIALDDLIARVSQMARRNPLIKADLSVNPDDTQRLREILIRQPLRILADTQWFQMGPGAFETTFPAIEANAITALVSEVVDWRLLRYFQNHDGDEDSSESANLPADAESGAPDIGAS